MLCQEPAIAIHLTFIQVKTMVIFSNGLSTKTFRSWLVRKGEGRATANGKAKFATLKTKQAAWPKEGTESQYSFLHCRCGPGYAGDRWIP